MQVREPGVPSSYHQPLREVFVGMGFLRASHAPCILLLVFCNQECTHTHTKTYIFQGRIGAMSGGEGWVGGGGGGWGQTLMCVGRILRANSPSVLGTEGSRLQDRSK